MLVTQDQEKLIMVFVLFFSQTLLHSIVKQQSIKIIINTCK